MTTYQYIEVYLCICTNEHIYTSTELIFTPTKKFLDRKNLSLPKKTNIYGNTTNISAIRQILRQHDKYIYGSTTNIYMTISEIYTNTYGKYHKYIYGNPTNIYIRQYHKYIYGNTRNMYHSSSLRQYGKQPCLFF